MTKVTSGWNLNWEAVEGGAGRPVLMRAALNGGWLVASKVAGGWSIAWVPEVPVEEGMEPAPRVTQAQLDGYLGKHIREVCGNGLAKDSSNHCAHFVNHVMGFEFGYHCRKATKGKVKGANVRVHETFARCGAVGAWPPPPGLTRCFAFVTRRSNVNLAKKTFANVPAKHIGIFETTHIWHYSNKQRKVIKQLPADFAKHYKGTDIAVFWGEFPPPM